MAEELGGGEAGGSDQIFASAKYYFPILICTRKETSKEPGKMLCKVVPKLHKNYNCNACQSSSAYSITFTVAVSK